MDNDKDILSKFNHKDGMKVPDGYFADFAQRMEAALPEKPATVVVDIPKTTWQKVRTYVYMAAMFAGIWCMLKMFNMMSVSTPAPIEDNPIVAEALENRNFVKDYVMSEVNQWEIYNDLLEEEFNEDLLSEAFENELNNATEQ